MPTITVSFSPVYGDLLPVTIEAPAGECHYWAGRFLNLVPEALTASYPTEESTVRPFSRVGLNKKGPGVATAEAFSAPEGAIS